MLVCLIMLRGPLKHIAARVVRKTNFKMWVPRHYGDTHAVKIILPSISSLTTELSLVDVPAISKLIFKNKIPLDFHTLPPAPCRGVICLRNDCQRLGVNTILLL